MHLVQTMAYVNKKPWHGLGNALAPQQPIEVWAEQAGMNWRIESADVRFAACNDDRELIHTYPEQKVLYRSDTKAPLSVVSQRYNVVQPREILEFYRDLVEAGGYELETAGVLKDGKKLWALARTGQTFRLKRKDEVNAYVLLATACDGTLATTAQLTSVRVVCNNTLAVALGEHGQAVKVQHRSRFDARAVKRELGLTTSSWDGFMDRMKALAECKVKDLTVENFIRRVVLGSADFEARPAPTGSERALKTIHALFSGRGRGAELASAEGTAWGMLNAVTEYVDHHRRARSDDYRRDAAWFGQGATLKRAALTEALKLVA